MAQPIVINIDPSVVARVANGGSTRSDGLVGGWFGPLAPLSPVAPASVEGRQFDYPAGYNLNIRPRTNEPVAFEAMRAVADSYDLLRLVIETRKDQLEKLEWTIKPKDPTAKADARCDELTAFFHAPDREHGWAEWSRALVEDMLVIDAATLYPRLNRGGGLYSLELMDGATIKRVLDQTGRTPLPPNPAYQQILKGLPAVDYTVEELIYRPRNIRTNRIYGYSPVEQVLMTVNIALRRQLFQLQYYTEGNVPEALASVPKEWNPQQIAQFQQYWDSMLTGNTAERRHLRFIPDGVNFQPTKESPLKDIYDEWLARIICFAFSISPQALVMQMNRATAETAKSSADEEGLAPLKNWLRRLINGIIVRFWGYADLEFAWQDKADIDPATRATIHKTYVDAKVITADEVRDELGLDPLTPEQKEELSPTPPPGENAAAPGQLKPNPAEPGDDELDKIEKAEKKKACENCRHPIQAGPTY